MSIRRYLVLILLSFITLITFLAAIQGYKASMEKASVLFDDELRSVAKILVLINPETYSSTVNSDSELAFQLWKNNQMLLKSSNAPDELISEQSIGFNESNFLGQRWRTYSLSAPSGNKVIVAQLLKNRFQLAEDVILAAVIPIVISIPVLTLFLFFSITNGLKPLTLLTQELKHKKANDLSLLSSTRQTKELEPVVNTLNQLFERLRSAFERERHFASDAAHELRTPLSVLKINLHNLRQAHHENGDFQQLEQSVDRMAHVVDQILTLNRTNPEQISVESERINVQGLLQETISLLYPEIALKHQNISLESTEQHMVANRFALHIMMQNLIANASKYTPEYGEIKVSVTSKENELTILVEDSGPGISPQEYARVFDRFYRVGGDSHHSTHIGCGLGLAIVKHIVQLHHANIALSQSFSLKGLQVAVTFSITSGQANV